MVCQLVLVATYVYICRDFKLQVAFMHFSDILMTYRRTALSSTTIVIDVITPAVQPQVPQSYFALCITISGT